MKSRKLLIHINLIIFLTLFMAMGLPNASAQDEAVTIAIAPFTLNAPEDMHYLRSGIQDMLESRLSQDENVMVISDEKITEAMEGIQEPIDENEAREIGRRLSVNYVLIGSLTVFGSSASLDAQLVDSAGEKETIAFFEQSESIDDLVPKINQFATDVTGSIVGGAATVALGAGTTTPAPTPTDDAREHPEKMAEETPQAEGGNKEKSGPPAATVGVLSEDFWKSRTYKINIHGLALGDVDGDKKIETVIISRNQLFIFRNEANKFYKIYELKKSSNKQFIGVDIGDFNGNGIAEIFISGLSPQKTSVSSLVLEFDGKEYQTIVKNSRRLYRVIHIDGQPPILCGQNFTPKTDKTNPIYFLHGSGTSYTAGSNVIAKASLNLMGFVHGDALNRGSNSVLAYNYSDRLELIDENNTHEWTDSEQLGGSTLSFSRGMTGKGDVDFHYLPMRVLLKDLDQDGQQEAIVVKNYEVAKRNLKDFRMFKDFHIASLSWDGLGMKPNWQTPKTSGYMRDFAIGDFDNDGKDELVGAVVMREDKIIGVKPKSTIVAYEIGGQ